MKRSGKGAIALCVLALTLLSAATFGAVTATIDRDQVALGDTLRLTLTATDGEELSEADLQLLHQDFEIIQSATSSNTSIINGSMSHTRQLIIDLIPRREGNIEIPSLQFGQASTASIPLVVRPAPDEHSQGQSVVFEAEVNRDTVYVQGEVILTLRLLQAIGLEGRSISELKLENAFVKPLEQRSFQRTIDGRRWLVDEIRYAIFPEQSGTLDIPAQVFSGRVDSGRRSFFNLGGSGGQMIRRNSQPVSITVEPKPEDYPAVTWLPTSELTVEESWSTPPEQLRVGESVTRTVRLTGEGLQGAQLPPVMFTPIDGLKYYPDQPQISEEEDANGLVGIRVDSAAVVPTRAGSYQIPAMRIAWWDTDTDQLQYAVVPAREITVAAAAPASTGVQDTTPSTPIAVGSESVSPAAPATQGSTRVWQIVSAVSIAGWLLTLVYLWLKAPRRARAEPDVVYDTSEKDSFRALLAACSRGDAANARAAFLHWVAAYYPNLSPVSADTAAKRFNDRQLSAELERLDRHLYSPGTAQWRGEGLAECVTRLRATTDKHEKTDRSLQLYPTG